MSLFTFTKEKTNGSLEAEDRMDLHSGVPYWLVRNGLHAAYPQLSTDLRTDVVIVGGGITGALCAHAFTKSGLSAVVVDGRSIGAGSTCASTSLLQYEIDTPLHDLVELVGEKNAVRSYKLCAHAVERLEVIANELGMDPFQRRPSVQYASERRHVKDLAKEHAIRKANGFDVDLLQSEEEVRTALPFAAPAALRSTLAAETDAYALTHALHAANHALGAQVFERTQVVEIRDSANGIDLRTHKGHTVKAKFLVHASGYETKHHLPKDVIKLHSTYALISEAGTAETPWTDNALIWETARPYLYMRTADAGRIIIGGHDEPFRNPAMRDALQGPKTKALEKDFRTLLPNIPFRREFAWCGTFGETKDGLPYIDRHPHDGNTFFALGMGGNGITFSVIAAEIIRDRILGRPNTDSDIFKFDR